VIQRLTAFVGDRSHGRGTETKPVGMGGGLWKLKKNIIGEGVKTRKGAAELQLPGG